MAKRGKRYCCECNNNLTKDEIALNQKLLGTEVDEFYCIKCLADYLECSTDDLRIKIQEFKEQGCSLFF